MTVFDVDELMHAGRTELGSTDWITLEAEAISGYAAAVGGPAPDPGAPAPPLMLLALTNLFLPQLFEVKDVAGVNYGAGSVRFGASARAGDRLRGSACLIDATEVPGGVQTTVEIRVEVDAAAEPGCVVQSLSRWLR